MGIIISNLSHRYNMSKRNSLTSINLELESENIYGLIGKNGSGKTTISNVLKNPLSFSNCKIEGQDGLDILTYNKDFVDNLNITQEIEEFLSFREK